MTMSLKRHSIVSHDEAVDQDKHRDAEGHLVRPANLALLTDDEYTKLGRKATRKMDLIIMPILTIMVMRYV